MIRIAIIVFCGILLNTQFSTSTPDSQYRPVDFNSDCELDAGKCYHLRRGEQGESFSKTNYSQRPLREIFYTSNPGERLLTSQSYIEVDLRAIDHNVRVIRKHIGSQVALLAVVKANAYGHGAVEVAKTALAAGAKCLGVARVQEGIELRQAGITAAILLLSNGIPSQAELIVSHDLIPSVTEMVFAQKLSECAAKMGRKVTLHIKVDTGMGRAGLLPQEVIPFMQTVASLPSVKIGGIFTHFAVANELQNPFTKQQFAVFQEVLTEVEKAGFIGLVRHAANSPAAMYHPETHLDMVRTGRGLYGMKPVDNMDPPFPMQPVLRLISKVTRVKTLPAGSSIGYGRTYISQAERRIALIPIGHGDGYRRSLSNQGTVLIRGQRAPLVGRVSMDQISVDVTDIPGVDLEDEVVLIGRQGEAEISLNEVAQWADTIVSEVTTVLMSRLPIVYLTDVKG